jgi:hypothetical protein
LRLSQSNDDQDFRLVLVQQKPHQKATMPDKTVTASIEKTPIDHCSRREYCRAFLEKVCATVRNPATMNQPFKVPAVRAAAVRCIC